MQNQEKRRNQHIRDLKHELEDAKKRIFGLESELEDTSRKKLIFERDIRRLEEKNKVLEQKVKDLLEDIEESELQRANEKRSKNRMREHLNEQKRLVRELEGEKIELEMKLDEIKSHDKILLKERDQYSESKFHLEGKLRSMEQQINQQKKEYLEIIQEKETLEFEIKNLKRKMEIMRQENAGNQTDWVFVRKTLHLAGERRRATNDRPDSTEGVPLGRAGRVGVRLRPGGVRAFEENRAVLLGGVSRQLGRDHRQVADRVEGHIHGKFRANNAGYGESDGQLQRGRQGLGSDWRSKTRSCSSRRNTTVCGSSTSTRRTRWASSRSRRI